MPIFGPSPDSTAQCLRASGLLSRIAQDAATTGGGCQLPLPTGSSEGGIVMVGTAYMSEEVFPPQIRALDTQAHHSIGKREILSLKTTAPAWREVKTAKIA